MYTVYIHINKVNNKRYIGITSQTVNNRWKNGYGYKSQKLFFRAIQKYGWDNFDHIIFAENLTKEQADKMEIALIALYKSNDNKYGYNVSDGGEKTTLGIKLSEEARCHMSEAHKGKVQTKETISKRVEQYSGTRHWLYGKHWDEKTKAKMRTAKLGKKQTKEHINNASITRYKPVLCVETQKTYKSLLEASKDLNVCKSSISEAVNGKRKTAGGYHWKFIDEIIINNPRTEVEITKITKEN